LDFLDDCVRIYKIIYDDLGAEFGKEQSVRAAETARVSW